MNKLRFIALAFALFATKATEAQITDPSPYCVAGYDDAAGFPVEHYISNVTLGSLNNTSGPTQFTTPHYAYYNSVTIPNLVQGNSYPISVSHDSSTTIHFVAVYIDFNNNNSFDDSGELVLNQSIAASTVTNPSTATILIPATAIVGSTRMRVMVFEDDNYTWVLGNVNPTPCTTDSTGFLDWGETEDYNVNIAAATTSCDTVTGLAITGITTTAATLNWTAVTGSIGYEQTVNTIASAPTTSGTATTLVSATYSSLLPSTNYYAHVRNNCGAGSFSDWVNVPFSTLNPLETNGVVGNSYFKITNFPNPVNDHVFIKIEGGINNNAELMVSDVTGRLVFKTQAIEREMKINTQCFSSGVYFVHYADSEHQQTIRFFKP